MVVGTPSLTSASSKLPALTLSPARLLITSQFSKPQLPPTSLDLSGQTAIVTGANNGIGLACAKLLLQQGLSHLIIAVRSEAKGHEAVQQLRQITSDAKIEVWRLDMGSYISIDAFVKRCETLHRLDYAILNAGMGNATLQINESTGHEETMQVNFLSTMYLSVLLLPLLKKKSLSSKPGRLTVVNSGTAMHCELPEAKSDPLIPAFDFKATFDGMSHYAKSKLLGQLFIDKLARHVDSKDVIINCVDPGLTKDTGLMDKAPIVIKVFMTIMTKLLGRTQEQAASTYIDAAIVKGEETHGCCYDAQSCRVHLCGRIQLLIINFDHDVRGNLGTSNNGSYVMDWRIYP
ncbi:ww oxidoreductase [Fusarium langsethiae]|uniref:Ww oxidoreductase n=1 Tax=Fusarium langsethiae TaxID=179993 RepID=A0A0N0DAV8_FUSLA|nr:ww oxidoreductase [Fusarium langsethiae]